MASFIGFFDRAIVNDIAINGPADTVRRLGVALRLHVTGHLYSYALAMTLGVVGLGNFLVADNLVNIKFSTQRAQRITQRAQRNHKNLCELCASCTNSAFNPGRQS